MKKLALLISASLLTLTANAATISVWNNTNQALYIEEQNCNTYQECATSFTKEVAANTVQLVEGSAPYGTVISVEDLNHNVLANFGSMTCKGARGGAATTTLQVLLRPDNKAVCYPLVG